MAIKKIASAENPEIYKCVRCRGKIKRLRNGGASKCQNCGTVHLIKFTENGNVVLTDKRYQHLFAR